VERRYAVQDWPPNNGLVLTVHLRRATRGAAPRSTSPVVRRLRSRRWNSRPLVLETRCAVPSMKTVQLLTGAPSLSESGCEPTWRLHTCVCAALVVVALALPGAGGCSVPPETPSARLASPAPPPTVAVTAPAPPTPNVPAEVQLVETQMLSPPTAGLPLITLSTRKLQLVGDERSVVPIPPREEAVYGVDPVFKRAGPNDLLIVPLAAALQRAHITQEMDLAIAADANTTYRLLVEVTFTCGQFSAVPAYHLIVRKESHVGEVMVRGVAPHMAIKPFAVFITSEGIGAKTAAGNVVPGCAGAKGGRVTIPRLDGKQDFQGLRRCIEALAPLLSPEERREATIAANPGIALADVVHAIDSLRVDIGGQPLFASFRLGIAR